MKNFNYFLIILISLLALIAAIVYNSVYSGGPLAEAPEEIPIEEEVIINYLYELPSDSFLIEYGKVKNNQTFSVLLSSLGIPHERINAVIKKAAGIFDAHKFRAGNKYTVFYNNDSIKSASYFIYEKDPVEYVVFDFRDSLNAWNGYKDIDTLTRNFIGSIQTSLWNVFTGQGANPMVAIELSEIFAWTVDFFGLQKNDSFRIVYEEYFIEDISIGIGNVHGAYFRHLGRDFWAIPFYQDGKVDFFDADGSSLRKAFLKAPLTYSRISSRYSNSRLHPVLKIRRPHHGVDYAAPTGTPVVSIGDGVVTKAGYDGGAGNMVKIKHNNTYSTAYLHLSRYGKGIKTGAYVKQGDVIGYVGSTGLSTGPHLDFRFYRNGAAIDPLKVESPPVEPIKDVNIDSFIEKKALVMDMINSF
jgi:murein DD-endopeptidase MepM/ murein hydrolase activator NlpD